jgi:hypothetical protein
MAGKTDYIDGVLVPKGTIFYIPIRVVNTWKEIWGEDAEECVYLYLITANHSHSLFANRFNPSRWFNLPPKYSSTTSVLSFLAGPHACIGKTMAIMEMKAVIAALIAKFEFTPAYAGQTIKPTAAVTMSRCLLPRFTNRFLILLCRTE